MTEKTKTYKVDWDTDGEEIDLPELVSVPENLEEDAVANYISDRLGWCINSLERVDVLSTVSKSKRKGSSGYGTVQYAVAEKKTKPGKCKRSMKDFPFPSAGLGRTR